MPPIDFSRRTALYRLYGVGNVLLYVGVAFSPEARWKDHASSASWWPQVVRKDVEWHETRVLALDREGTAIETECPRYNLRGAQRPVVLPCATKPGVMSSRMVRVGGPMWERYGAACKRLATTRSDELRRHMMAVVAADEREQRRIARESGGAANS